MAEEDIIEVPEENIASASGFVDVNSTKPIGDKGAVEELDKTIKKSGPYEKES
jgi:hypothetical protein